MIAIFVKQNQDFFLWVTKTLTKQLVAETNWEGPMLILFVWTVQICYVSQVWSSSNIVSLKKLVLALLTLDAPPLYTVSQGKWSDWRYKVLRPSVGRCEYSFALNQILQRRTFCACYHPIKVPTYVRKTVLLWLGANYHFLKTMKSFHRN